MREKSEKRWTFKTVQEEMALKKSLQFGIAALLAMAAAGICRAQTAAALPQGVKAVWDFSKAYRERTPTRERICINGLWLWQPTTGAPQTVPTGDWGYFKVPGPWPGHEQWMEHDSQTVWRNPVWAGANLGDVTAAWYQREIAVPADWAGRRITLSADCLNSYAAVYLDGKKAGELRFPGGEADVTAQCRPGATQALSLLVIAAPLSAVMVSNQDTIGSKEVQGHVDRRGLCGDVWLTGAPMGPRILDVQVRSSVRKWEITFEAGLGALAPGAPYVLKAEVSAPGLPNHEFTSKPFTAAELNGSGRFAFTSSWKPERLWDINTPENMYQASLSLLGADSTALDVAAPERFGFREMWINGRDFYLNGSRIWLFGCPLDNAMDGVKWADYDGAKETMLRMKSFGTNFVYGHNYGCEPGSHLSYAAILRAADDAGMLAALPMPHFHAYDWTAPDADQTNGYASHAEYYARQVARNHPSVIMYGMSYNSAAYFGATDPYRMDGLKDIRTDGWSKNGEAGGLRTQAILEKFDTTRLIYHHGCGDMGEMIALNFFVNFVPVQELTDWFGHWAKEGVKPVFLCENASPGGWDFSMYRGYYHYGRVYGEAVVPWELCAAQWNAQFLGDEAMQISQQEKQALRWESEQFRSSAGWHRWDYPIEFEQLEAIRPVIAEYIADNLPAWRACGLSANTNWNSDSFWTLRPGVDTGRSELKVDWETLQRPGFSPDYVEKRPMTMWTDFAPSDWAPTVCAETLLRNNMPLLAYIAGKPDSYTSKDHNFLPGEMVHKQLIVINNSRVPATFECAWSADLRGIAPGGTKGSIETGEEQRIPLDFAIPADAAPGPCKLTATVKFGTGESQEDSFRIDVMQQAPSQSAGLKMALFDPEGETGKLLDGMKIPYQAVDAKADLSGFDILVVGRKALTADGPAPNIMRVRDGLRVIVFEQTCDALTKRLGFRAGEQGLRRVFKRVPDSPLLAGLDTDNLHDWRGNATLLQDQITYPFKESGEEDMVEWCGAKVSHIWRCGCLGSVSSVLIEKPACGNFLPIVDGGWGLEYSPLMVYSEGKGMVLFCQMDVTGRTESDPAAETLAANIVRYVLDWRPTETARNAVYAGDPAGERHLKHSGIVPAAYEPGKLSPRDVLVVGIGGGKTLAADAQSLAAFINGGGKVLALGLDEGEAQTLLSAVQMKKQEHISTFFKPFGQDSLLAGIGPADVYNAAAGQIPLVTEGAETAGDGVLARSRGADVLFFQLPPYSVTTAEGAVQSFAVDDADAPPGLKQSALIVMGTCSKLGVSLMSELTTTPLSEADWKPRTQWFPEVGKTYTVAGLFKGVGGPVEIEFGAQRSGGGWDWAMQVPNAVAAEGKWTELHGTFKCEKPYPEGWTVRVNCAQENAAFRIAMLRLNEGEYVPCEAGAALPANLVTNGSFEGGTRRYWFQYGEQINLRRTYRRTSFVMTRALANLGVACPTPLLTRFAGPVSGKAEERWASGLYVDEVWSWDDPYRAFNW